MKKQEVVRAYKFTDGKLITLGGEKIAFVRRDITEFISYNVTNVEIDALEAMITDFEDFPTDVELEGVQHDATVIKDAKAEALRVAIRAVMTRVELKFKLKTARYTQFGTGDLSHKSDSELLITGRRVVRVANNYFTELATKGLTATMLTDITTLCASFENLIIDQKLKIGNRDIVQEDRVEAGNAIYTILTSFTTTGQAIWKTSNVAKYNDYVIYNTSSGEDEGPDDSGA